MSKNIFVTNDELALLYDELNSVPDVEKMICTQNNIEFIDELPRVRFGDAMDFIRTIKAHRFSRHE